MTLADVKFTQLLCTIFRFKFGANYLDTAFYTINTILTLAVELYYSRVVKVNERIPIQLTKYS